MVPFRRVLFLKHKLASWREIYCLFNQHEPAPMAKMTIQLGHICRHLRAASWALAVHGESLKQYRFEINQQKLTVNRTTITGGGQACDCMQRFVPMW